MTEKELARVRWQGGRGNSVLGGGTVGAKASRRARAGMFEQRKLGKLEHRVLLGDKGHGRGEWQSPCLRV